MFSGGRQRWQPTVRLNQPRYPEPDYLQGHVTCESEALKKKVKILYRYNESQSASVEIYARKGVGCRTLKRVNILVGSSMQLVVTASGDRNPGILRSVITCPFMEGYKLHLTQTQ